MDHGTTKILFALMRSAIGGEGITKDERSAYSAVMLGELLKVSAKHDEAHLVALGLMQNGLVPEGDEGIEKYVFRAVYRCERMKYELALTCDALERAGIPFIPLKGSVTRDLYPEGWMRTSGDIDILVGREDFERAVRYLSDELGYDERGRSTHDVTLNTPNGVQIELHFDLVEEDCANNAIGVLRSVWDNVSLKAGYGYWYEMSDDFFYFYHIAPMAKHFEHGGCGIRPFIDLWILDRVEGADKLKRDALLSKGRLLKFANVSRAVSEVWFGGRERDKLSRAVEGYVLRGGVHGSVDNRVALQQKKNGGRIGYMLSRIFVPYARLKRYYPILEKHKWLTPFMQVRRWFKLFEPEVARMACQEISVNGTIDKAKAAEMGAFLADVGL